jgi:protein TonB
MEANKILSSDILDILFEGKNKEYGAYDLRKTYNRRITRALIITAAVAGLALLGSVLASEKKKDAAKFKKTEVNIQKVEENKDEPPPPPPPPPPKQEPPKVEMEKFTPPVIKKDEEVVQPPPPQEKLEEVKISDVTQEGIKEEVVAPTVIDEGKKIVEEKKEEDENKIFDKVEIEASFPGGDSKWRQFLERNLNANTPVDNGAPADKYTVYVQFIVDKEGNISDVKATTNHGYGMEQEAVRVIKSGPKWTPAIQNGRQVKAYRKQPITFVVTGDE